MDRDVYAKVFRAIERAGGLATFAHLRQDIDMHVSSDQISQAITALEEAGRIAILLGPKQTVFYASQATLEIAR